MGGKERQSFGLMSVVVLFVCCFKIYFYRLCICGFGDVCVSPGASGGKKRKLDALRLLLQAAVNGLVWVLGADLQEPYVCS